MEGKSAVMDAQASGSDLGHLAGKYLTFGLGREVYGLAILKVQEIIGLMEVTKVPRTPAYVRGVINLRGKVIPVIEMRKKFEMPAEADTERTCIIVVQAARGDALLTMGILVDRVSEVLEIRREQLEPAPSLGLDIDTQFILAMGKIHEDVVMLLDVDRVLTGEDMNAVERAL